MLWPSLYLPQEHKDCREEDASLVDGIPERHCLNLKPVKEHACMRRTGQDLQLCTLAPLLIGFVALPTAGQGQNDE